MKKTDTRSKTGIKLLDNILDGGIPRGSTVLLTGTSGTGKTIICLEYVFNGFTQYNESAVYISLTEPVFKLMRNLEKFEFYNPEAIKSEQIELMDLRAVAEKTKTKEERTLLDDPASVIDVIRDAVEAKGAKRLVLDSVTALCYHIKDEARIREFIFKLGTVLAGLECTTILTSEMRASSDDYSVFGVEEFISDGVIMLQRFEREGILLRTLHVIKMRGIEHSQSKYMLGITSYGVELTPLFKKLG